MRFPGFFDEVAVDDVDTADVVVGDDVIEPIGEDADIKICLVCSSEIIPVGISHGCVDESETVFDRCGHCLVNDIHSLLTDRAKSRKKE